MAYAAAISVVLAFSTPSVVVGTFCFRFALFSPRRAAISLIDWGVTPLFSESVNDRRTNPVFDETAVMSAIESVP